MWVGIIQSLESPIEQSAEEWKNYHLPACLFELRHQSSPTHGLGFIPSPLAPQVFRPSDSD